MQFKYVGPKEILEDVKDQPIGKAILCKKDIHDWRALHQDEMGDDRIIISTYTVGIDGILRLASRNSEHVACAGGGPVLTAGELSTLDNAAVENITNQSTGFCTSENSWPAIANALDKAGLSRPTGFSNTVIFRKCPNCKERILVKDDWFVCLFCDTDLPTQWNFDQFYS